MTSSGRNNPFTNKQPQPLEDRVEEFNGLQIKLEHYLPQFAQDKVWVRFDSVGGWHFIGYLGHKPGNPFNAWWGFTYLTEDDQWEIRKALCQMTKRDVQVNIPKKPPKGFSPERA